MHICNAIEDAGEMGSTIPRSSAAGGVVIIMAMDLKLDPGSREMHE